MTTATETKDSPAQAVRRAISDTGVDAGDGSQKIDDMGLSSIDLLDITMGLEDQFAVEIPESDLAGLTIDGLIKLVETRASN